jgi:hypothetical protein
MDISVNLFLVPAFLAILLVTLAVIKKTVTDVKQYKIGEKKQSGLEILIEVVDRINIFTPKEGSKLYNGYKSFLRYSRLSVKKLFRIKLLMFVIAIYFCCSNIIPMLGFTLGISIINSIITPTFCTSIRGG